MKQGIFHRLWSLFSILSLDVVSGALAGMYFFENLWDVVLDPEMYFLLGLAVWIVYTADHLLDVRHDSPSGFASRHAFHRKYWKVLTVGMIVGIIVGLGILITTPKTHIIIPYGLGLGLLIGLWYCLLIFKKEQVAHLKEFITALVYTLGISLAPGVFAFEDIQLVHIGLLLGYFLLAFTNLIILSYFDRSYDEAHAFGSIGARWSEAPHKNLCFGLLYVTIGGLILAMMLVFSYYRLFFGILLLIAVIHYRLFRVSEDKMRARGLMEISFSLPWLLLLF
ncbi:MAG: hypothetical protein ACXIUD_00955 [Mongoliitalea sp.]